MHFCRFIIHPLAALLLLSGCFENQQRPNLFDTDRGRVNSPAEERTESPRQERISYERISSMEAIDFVQTWSKIYTTHTFDNYIRMYDRYNFTGIKRTFQGERNTYDFAGWVSNKRNEFNKFRPEVFVEDVKVKYLNQNGKTKVSFIQKWYSTTSNYADQGEKILILFKQNGEIFIEKEELLYSEPLYLEQGE